jgi:hypothetical protein
MKPGQAEEDEQEGREVCEYIGVEQHPACEKQAGTSAQQQGQQHWQQQLAVYQPSQGASTVV